MKFVNFATAAAFAAFTLPALSQTSSTPRIDKRQADQERRIERGDEARVGRLDLRLEAQDLAAAAVDQVLVKVPSRGLAGRFGELGKERIGRRAMHARLAEHREVHRVLVDAEARDR